MTCEEAKEELRRRFDDGEDLKADLESHMSGCASCMELLERLETLQAAFVGVPLEPIPEGLTLRVKRAVKAQRPRPIDAIPAAVAATVVLAAVGLVGWLFPVSLVAQSRDRITEQWQKLGEWFPQSPSLWSEFQPYWESAVGRYETSPTLSPVLLWSLLGITLFMFVSFNAFETMKLRTTFPDSPQGHRDAARHRHTKGR